MAKKIWLFVLGVAVGAVPTYVGWNREVRGLQGITQPLADQNAKLERDNQYLRAALGDGTVGRHDRRMLSMCMQAGATRAAAIGSYKRGDAMAPSEAAAFAPLRPIVVRNREMGVDKIATLLLDESLRLDERCLDESKVPAPVIPR